MRGEIGDERGHGSGVAVMENLYGRNEISEFFWTEPAQPLERALACTPPPPALVIAVRAELLATSATKYALP